MKLKHILLSLSAFVLALIFSACSQENKPGQNTEQTQDEESGVLRQLWPNGNVMVEQSIKDGKRNGLSKKFYENGIINTETNYVDHKREGLSKFYYPSGKIYRESTYVNDKLNGPRKIYYQGGELMSEQTYLNGHPGADLKEFSSLGELRNEKYKLSINKRSRGNVWAIDAELNKNNEKATFYLGVLSQGLYLNDSLREMVRTPTGAAFDIQKDEVTPGYSVIAVVRSRQKNDIILYQEL